MEQAVLTVDSQRFGGQARDYDLEVRKAWDDIGTGNVAQRIDQISQLTLADVENLSKFCAKVAHGVFLWFALDFNHKITENQQYVQSFYSFILVSSSTFLNPSTGMVECERGFYRIRWRLT